MADPVVLDSDTAYAGLARQVECRSLSFLHDGQVCGVSGELVERWRLKKKKKQFFSCVRACVSIGIERGADTFFICFTVCTWILVEGDSDGFPADFPHAHVF